MLFVVSFECSQVGVHGWAESARELTLQFHVPNQRVGIVVVPNRLVNVGGGLRLLQFIDAAVALAVVVAREAVAIDAAGSRDIDDGLNISEILLAAATVIFLSLFRKLLVFGGRQWYPWRGWSS